MMICKFKYLFFIFFLYLHPLKITRAIISWDNNSTFEFFWPIVSKAWSELIGVRPTLIFIGTKQNKLNNLYGDIIYFDPIVGLPTPFQAMAIRPLAAALFPNDVCILTDLDMIPISKTYFEKAVSDLNEDNLAVFYPNFYGIDASRYMMCYNVAKGCVFSDIFNINNISDIRRTLYYWYINYYNQFRVSTDEKMLFKYINEWKFKEERLKLLNLKFARLNREKWEYKKYQIKKGLIADAHLPRPYLTYKKEINNLLRNLKINLN